MRLFRTALVGMFVVSMLVASPISYTLTGVLNGLIGEAVFNAKPFIFVVNADTAGVYAVDPELLYNPALSTLISIMDVGSGSFTESIFAGVEHVNGIVGITNLFGSGGVTIENAGAIGWALASPIGPLGAASPYFASGFLGTTFGTLQITGARDLVYSANTGIPEPSTGLLVGAVLVAAFGLRRKLSHCLRRV
jgi:hypothetical protein